MAAKQWLLERITVEEAEARYKIVTGWFPEGRPFGWRYDRLKRLLSHLQDDDELWTYSTRGVNWTEGTGFEGVALVRDGEVVESVFAWHR